MYLSSVGWGYSVVTFHVYETHICILHILRPAAYTMHVVHYNTINRIDRKLVHALHIDIIRWCQRDTHTKFITHKTHTRSLLFYVFFYCRTLSAFRSCSRFLFSCAKLCRPLLCVFSLITLYSVFICVKCNNILALHLLTKYLFVDPFHLLAMLKFKFFIDLF